MTSNNIIGKTKEFNSISKTILSADKLFLISVSGPQGCGKTFLLKEIYKNVQGKSFAFWFAGKFDSVDFFKFFVVNYPQFSSLFWKIFSNEEIENLVKFIPEFASLLNVNSDDSVPAISLDSLLFKFVDRLVKNRSVAIFVDNAAPLEKQPVLNEIIARFRRAPVALVFSSTEPFGEGFLDFRLKNFSLRETENFLKLHGVKSDISNIFEATNGNPLKLSLFVRALKEGKNRLTEITCNVTAKTFKELDIAQKRILALYLLFRKPITDDIIDYFFEDHSDKVGVLLEREIFDKAPEGRYMFSHPAWEKCVDRSVKIMAGKLKKRVLEKLVKRKDLWYLGNENFLGLDVEDSGIRRDYQEFLLYLYRKFLEEKRFKEVTGILDFVIKNTERRERKDRLLFEYGRFLVERGRFDEVGRVISQISDSTLKIGILGKLAVHFSLNNRIGESGNVLSGMENLVTNDYERDYVHYIGLVCKSISGGGKEGVCVIEEYDRFIKTTKFDDLRMMATEAKAGSLMCLNGWKKVVDDYREKECFRKSGNLLLCAANSAAYTGDFDVGMEAIKRFEDNFLYKTSITEFSNYLGIRLVLAFARGDDEGFQRHLGYFRDVLKIYGNKLYEQETRKAELHYFREKGDLDNFERILNGEWIKLGCFPESWHERFLDVNRAWLLAHRGDIEGAETIIRRLSRYTNLRDMDVYSILNLYRVWGYVEFKKGNKERAEEIWNTGIEKMKKWGLMTLVMFFYRYLTQIKGRGVYRKKWKGLVLSIDAPGWYDDPEEGKQIFLMRKGKIKLYTLGNFAIQMPWRDSLIDEREIRYKKAMDVLGLLVAGGKDGVQRESLLIKVWPDSSTTNPLDIAISNLKSLVWKKLTLTERGRLRLNSEFVDVDAWRFEALAKRGIEEPDIDDALEILEKAVELYGGKFMPQSNNVEIDIYRSYLESLHRTVALKLGKIWLVKGEGVKSVLSVYRLIREDVLDEEANLLLARGYYLMGNRALALRHLRKFREIYRRELGVDIPVEVGEYMNFLEGVM